MTLAWEIAKIAADNFGGKKSQYFVESLKMAWKKIKGVVVSAVDTMIELGGNEWKSGEKHRIYFNNFAELAGLVVNRYNTGSISSAYLNGSKLSNSKTSKMLSGKLYFDVNTNEFIAQSFMDETVVDMAIEKIRAAIN